MINIEKRICPICNKQMQLIKVTQKLGIEYENWNCFNSNCSCPGIICSTIIPQINKEG